MPTLQDKDQDSKYNPAEQRYGGEHDDLGVSNEQRKAELDDLESLYNAESLPNESRPTKNEQTEKSTIDDSTAPDNNWDTSTTNNDSKLRSMITRRRSIIGGGVIGGIAGVVMLLTGLSGPAELLHLDVGLSKNENAHSSIINRRIGRMVQRTLVKSSDDRLLLGRSRLGIVQQRVFGGMLDRLENQGIFFEETQGRFTTNSRPTVRFNLPDDSPLKGSSATRTRLNIARELGIDPKKLEGVIGNNNASFTLRQLDLTTAELDNLKRGLARHAGGGRVTNPKLSIAINKRLFAKVFGTPSLFHPISRTSEAVGRRIDNFIEARRARKQDNIKRSAKSSKINEKKFGARKLLKERINSTGGAAVMKTAGAAIAIQGVMCTVKGIADIIPTVYWGTVVVPATIREVQTRSVASQIKAGNDITMMQVDDAVSSLRDSQGRSVHGSAGINALVYGGEGRGTDIDMAAKSAFTTTGSSISELMSVLELSDNEDGTSSNIYDDISGWACSPIAQVGGFLAGVTLTAAGIAGGGATGGTTTAGTVGRIATQAVAAGAVTLAASKIIGDYVSDRAQGMVADACGVEFDPGEGDGDPEDIEVLDAEAYGNCLAYASRMSSNMNALSMGGVPISKSDELALINDAERRSIAELQEKSLTTRLFSMRDEKSLIMTLLKPSTQPGLLGGNLNSIASSLIKSPASIFTKSLSALSPNIGAVETTSYDWGFPLVSMPLRIVDDPRYSDPVENANWIADNQSSLDDKKIERCFGVKIHRGEGESLKTIPLDEEINLLDEYYNAGCDNLSDPTWIRTALFIMDDSIARAMDCYEGSTTSCAELGIGTASVSASSPTTTTGTLPSGDASSIAKEILENESIGKNDAAKTQLKGIASGAGPCANVNNGGYSVDVEILRIISALGQNNSFSISSLHRGCTGSTVGAGNKSKHWRGKAVDISGSNPINGVTMPRFDSFNETILNFVLEISKLTSANNNCGLGLPNANYTTRLQESAFPCAKTFLDTPSTTGATGPHIHIEVP